MVRLAALESRHGYRTSVEYGDGLIQPLAEAGKVDAFIVSTEDGFSPLGANRSYLAFDLGIPESMIRALADWNRIQSPRISLIGLRSQRSGSRLRGVILAAAGSSMCYE